jgi:hypothetical protein
MSTQTADQTLIDYFRLAAGSLGCSVTTADVPRGESGFFHFGRQICDGRCLSTTTRRVLNAIQFDAARHRAYVNLTVWLPFSLAEVVDNLRLERHREKIAGVSALLNRSDLIGRAYSLARSALPLSMRRQLQKAYFRDWHSMPFPAWPVDSTVDRPHQELLRLLMETAGVNKVPFIWFWPEGAPGCIIMTHDVETAERLNFTSGSMDVDEHHGIRASFQVIPEERHELPDGYIAEIRRRGFEFNIHDLNHDGRLYRDRRQYNRRAALINGYIRKHGASGVRAGSMYRNQAWYEEFEFSYDMSVPNVAHLEPMCGGCYTVMPYFIGGILELPLTLTQDYSLFHILGDHSIDVWTRQMALIEQQNGLMSFIVHPDYLIEPRARQAYVALLDCLRQTIAQKGIWAALPGDVDLWWRARSRMSLVERENGREITGPESERARLAYAVLEGDRLVYELDKIGSRADAVQ